MAENEKYSKEDFSRGLLVYEGLGLELLFSTSGIDSDDLTPSQYPVTLVRRVNSKTRAVFSDNGIVLVSKAKVITKSDSLWLVVDTVRTYTVMKFDSSFAVYKSISEKLDAGIIPDALKSELGSLDPSAGISDIRPNNRWVIQNGAKKLIVYKDKEFRAAASLRVYREDFTLETDLIPGTEIVGTCFYRESPLGEIGDPRKTIFPLTMTGVTFRRCNLDNVFVPPGNTIMDDGGIQSSHRRIRVQNDLEDWIVDASGNPIEPVGVKIFQELGLSILPKDIPPTLLAESLTQTASAALLDASEVNP